MTDCKYGLPKWISGETIIQMYQMVFSKLHEAETSVANVSSLQIYISILLVEIKHDSEELENHIQI